MNHRYPQLLRSNWTRSTLLALSGLGLAWSAGCNEVARSPGIGSTLELDRSAPPPRGEEMKPLPGLSRAEPPPMPYEDAPLVYQQIPEQKAFVEAYNRVQRPRIVVFVNRTLTGETAGHEPAPVDSRQTDPYLRSGQYDEALAKQIDYAAIENTLSQWLACDGQTVIVSPHAVRERLTEAEVQRLQNNQPRLIGELVRQLNADIVIYAQARPTRQTEKGLEIRLIAEAINVTHGERIGGANLLILPPLDTEKVNRFTRYLSRKLMSDMTLSWSGPGPNAVPNAAPPVAPPANNPAPGNPPTYLPPAGNGGAPQPGVQPPYVPPVPPTDPKPSEPAPPTPPAAPSTNPSGGTLQTIIDPPPTTEPAIPEPTPLVPSQVPPTPAGAKP